MDVMLELAAVDNGDGLVRYGDMMGYVTAETGIYCTI